MISNRFDAPTRSPSSKNANPRHAEQNCEITQLLFVKNQQRISLLELYNYKKLHFANLSLPNFVIPRQSGKYVQILFAEVRFL